MSRGRIPKYVVDTQLFINAFRDRAAQEALERFHHGYAPFEYLSVVVAQELRAGVRRPADHDALAGRHCLTASGVAGVLRVATRP